MSGRGWRGWLGGQLDVHGLRAEVVALREQAVQAEDRRSAAAAELERLATLLADTRSTLERVKLAVVVLERRVEQQADDLQRTASGLIEQMAGR